MTLRQKIKNFASIFLHTKKSYAQCGEDLIIDFLFTNYLKIKKPSYPDIGAHHPSYLSNTYLFYKKGCKGVCIEPDPTLFYQIKKKRPKDICLNIGIGTKQEESTDFYIMSAKALNTCSKKEAERIQNYGNQKIEKVIKIPLVIINKIIEEYFDECPNLISLDIEGLDFEILKSLNFNLYKPEVICAETLTYTEDKSETKIQNIIDLIVSKGYFIYADTFLNTIFVDKHKFNA